MKHILNVEKGKGPQNPIRMGKDCQIFLQELAERKNTLKHFELNEDRGGFKGGGL